MPATLIKGKYFTLNEIVDHLKRNKFIYNTEFQRSGLIWPKYKQEKLIDSIIKNLSIGLLFLKKRGKKYEVLDGQQRLKTIYEFVKGTFNTSADFTPEFPNKIYKDLKKDKRRFPDFRAFKVYYTLVVSGTEQEVSDIFLRLQEGMPLNTPEKLNAILGEMRNFIVDVSKHPIFKNISITNHRFSHRHLAAQITLLELSTNFKTQLFPDLRLKDVSQMYKKHKLEIPRGLHKRVHGALNLLKRILSKDAKVIRKKSDFPLIYILTSYLRKKYIINKSAFRNFVISFFTELEQINIEEEYEEENEYTRYKKLRKRGLTAKTFKERFEILLSVFLNEAPAIQLKDEQRGFDFGQKLAIYYKKDMRICQSCKEVVEWENASFHRIKFHGKGGPTTVENAQLMHKKCHEEFHDKKGPDIDI